jgi:hypothetical protein
MFKNVYKTVCISTIIVSPITLSATPPTSTMKNPENTEENLDDPETADQGDA